MFSPIPTNFTALSIGGALEMTLDGDWDRASTLLRRLDPVVFRASLNGQRNAARKIRKMVLKNIDDNGARIGWPSVSADYATYKLSQGGDPGNLYYMGGYYRNNITIFRRKYQYFVGLRKEVRNPKSKLPLWEIGLILEEGSSARGIKARPLWGPSFDHFGGNQEIIRHIKQSILRASRKAGIPMTSLLNL